MNGGGRADGPAADRSDFTTAGRENQHPLLVTMPAPLCGGMRPLATLRIDADLVGVKILNAG
jgi:hypothetical protein